MQPGSDPLANIPLFAHLSRRERCRIARELVETRYRKDEFIFREGEPARCFHVLKEGTVKCLKTSPNGRQVTLKVLMPGDLFCCDAAVLNGGCHPGSAQPMSDVSVLSLPKEAYYRTASSESRHGVADHRVSWQSAAGSSGDCQGVRVESR